ncbi:MAG TPA: DUF6094 domain-containing protein [Candidatus Angelobacter sp.]|nr:DUF6094 domain-containing protein [Candidatus Angelobacter sp.]
MRNAGRLKLGFYPLPQSEAQRLRRHLSFPDEPFAALDPCIGDGAAFQAILDGTVAFRYGIELDAHRAEQSQNLGIETIHGSTLEVQCRVDSLAFLYLNPPYDFEVGKTDNQRMEVVFLRHTGRWIMPGGVLFLVIPQRQLGACARTLAEHFENIRIYRLTAPESVKYNQIAVLAIRRKRHNRLRDDVLSSAAHQLEQLSEQNNLPALPDTAEALYRIPVSSPPTFSYQGLPLDEIEDKVLESSAYRQVRRILLRERGTVRGRPLTPLHGGHVGLLCTSGMLNGIFGEGELRHIANWQSRKYTTSWHEEEDGKQIHHTREYFSHECTLLWVSGKTQVLTHEAKEKSDESEAEADDPDFPRNSAGIPQGGSKGRDSKVIVMPDRGAEAGSSP